jgi:hypothetical protein
MSLVPVAVAENSKGAVMYNEIPVPQLDEPIEIAAMRKVMLDEMHEYLKRDGITPHDKELTRQAIQQVSSRSTFGQNILREYMNDKANMLQSIYDKHATPQWPKPLLDWLDYFKGSIERAQKAIEDAKANLTYLEGVNPNKLPVSVRIKYVEWDDYDKPIISIQQEGTLQEVVNLALDTFKTQSPDEFIADCQVQVSCKFPGFVMNAKREHVQEMIEIWKTSQK